MKRVWCFLLALSSVSVTASMANAHGRFLDATNRSGCKIWVDQPETGQTVTWSGPCTNGYAEGKGELISKFTHAGEARESRYEGTLKRGKTHGHGKARWSNGIVYEGEFRTDKLHGQGKFTWPNGDTYEGVFRDDKFSGQGVLSFAHGGRYEGEFSDDRFHGRGTYYFANGDRCTGNWKWGEMDGAGQGHRGGADAPCRAVNGKIEFAKE